MQSTEELNQKALELAYNFAAPLYALGQNKFVPLAVEIGIAVFTRYLFSDQDGQATRVKGLEKLLEARNNTNAFNAAWNAYKTNDDYRNLIAFVAPNTGFDFSKVQNGDCKRMVAKEFFFGSYEPTRSINALSSVDQFLSRAAQDPKNPFYEEFLYSTVLDLCMQSDHDYVMARAAGEKALEMQNNTEFLSIAMLHQRLQERRIERESAPLSKFGFGDANSLNRKAGTGEETITHWSKEPVARSIGVARKM